MSNVIIGIIGVVLFIGLALAGALFLGPRFQESVNSSRASASVQAVSQVSSAANLYQLQEGHAPALLTDVTSGGYLKEVPANPTGGTAPTLGTGVVTMILGNNAAPICLAVIKQTTGTTLADATAIPTTAPTGPTGCYKSGTDYVVQARI